MKISFWNVCRRQIRASNRRRPVRTQIENLEDRCLLASWTGDLPNGTHWTNSEVQILTADVHIPAGSTLTIDPGTVIKFANPSVDLTVDGKVLAQGTEGAPITFTEFRDDIGGDTNGDGSNSSPSNGFWGKIKFQNGSSGSVFDHVNIRYGGNSNAALEVNGASLTLSNSTVANSFSTGVRIQNSSPILNHNSYLNNSRDAVSSDLASQLVSSGSTATGNSVNGITLDPGTLTGNVTWNTPDLSLYMPGTITVSAGSTLTVAAGQIVKLSTSGTNNLIVNGTLTAAGTNAAPVIFTSARDSTAGGDLLNRGNSSGSNGDWGRIEFTSTSTGSTLDHTKVRFGGFGALGEVLVTGGQLTLTNSELRNSSTSGLRVQDSDPTVTNVLFGQNSIAASMDLASNPAITNVTLTNNTLNGLRVDNGSLTKDGIWNDPEITYFLAGTVTVPVDKSLTIAAGQIVKMNFSGTTDLIVAGTLNAAGTLDHPIIVTSARDDSVGGDTENDGPTTGSSGAWGHLEFSNPTTDSSLDHVEIRYGGFAANSELYVKGGKLSIQNTVVRDSSSNGIRIETSQPTLSAVKFQNIHDAAISMDMGSNPTISTPIFNSNGVNGLRLDGGVLTANGFWNDPEITYFLPTSVTVPDNLTLTIGAGQIVKAGFNGTVDLIVNGALFANGTVAQPIVITSSRNDAIGTDIDNNGPTTPINGDWGHVEFTNPNRASTLNHVEISYGGYGSEGLVVERGALVSIQNSTIRNASQNGLRVLSGNPSLTNVDLRDNGLSAVLLDPNSSITASSLSASGNQNDFILINSGDFTSNQTWDAAGIDFRLANSITIPQGLSLTIGAGSIYAARDNTKILGVGTILNAGTIRKTTGPADSTISPHVINMGTITAQSGLLILSGGLENNGSGVINGATSATVSTQQNLTGDVTHSSEGTVQPQIVFNGAGNAAQPQLLEVFSNDLGNKDVGFDHNFGYGSIKVESGSYLKLVDSRDNSPGGSPEALYVDNLTVAGGGTLNLNGLHVYTRSSVVDGTVVGGTVTILPDGGALSLNSQSPGKIGSVGEFDDWTIFGRAGQTVTITLSTGPTGTNPVSLPSLNFAQLQLIDPSNHVLGSVASTTSGADLQLTGITLPADGTYHIHVQAAPTQSSRTGNYVLGAFDTTIRVAPAELNQTIAGQIDNPFRIDRWTYSAVAGQIINFDVVNTQNSSIQFDLTGPNGFTAFTNQTADKQLVTLPTAGTYTLSVHTVQQQTGAYAFRLDSVSVNSLALGGTFTGPVTGAGQAQIFKVNVPQLQQLQVLLADTSASDRNEVYVNFGSAPTRSDYQYKFNTTASANQLLNIPSAAPGDWYVLVYTEAAPQPGTITLRVNGGSLFVNDVTPDHLGNGADQVLTLTGVGFDNTTSVSLISASNVVFNANSVRLDQPTQVTATFNAGIVPAGTYSVRVTKSDGGISTLSNAFTVTVGGVAHLETKVIVSNPIGLHISSTLYVQYTNSGTVAMAAPLLVLTGIQNGQAGALLTLDPALQVSGFWTSATPAGYSQSVQILASGAIPGILGPGETATVPVYYAGWLTSQWDFSRPPIFFNLGSLTNASTDVVDWPALKESLQPASISDQAWDGIYANLVAQLGPTWGGVIQHLDEDAAYLGSLGQHVTDLSALWSFEIQRANGLGPIPYLAVSTEISAPSAGLPLQLSRLFGSSITARNLNGPFGKGWQLDGGWGQTLTVAGDGTVSITDGTSVRMFQPDSRSSAYFSQPGDRALLSKVSSNVYTLTDPNGLVTQFQDGRVVLLRDPSGNAVTADYSGSNLSSLTSTSGQSISFTYNNSGHIASLSNSIGQSAQFTYDATNQYLLSATDMHGVATSYTYDTGTSPATRNSLLTITDAGGVQQVLTYDSQGRLKTTAFQGGILASEFGYGPAGIVTVTNPADDATSYYYDARGLLAKVVNPLQETTFYSYNSTGNLLSVTNPAGNIYSYAYDSQGRAVQLTNPLGQVTRYTYGTFNTITSVTDPNGNRTTFEFDPNGNALSQTFADGTIESLAYDPIGQITKSTDGNGNVINYTYNSAGKVTHKYYADGSDISFNYNAVSDLTSVVDPTGTTTLEYYGPNQLKQITYPDGSFLKYTYDSAGRRTQMVDQTGYTVRFHYDTLGRFDGLTDGSNQPIITYAYDLNSRLQLATKANGTSTEYTYDKIGSVLSIINHGPGGAINSSFVYTYNNQSLCDTETTLQGKWVYTYDATGQLTRAVFTSNNVAQAPSQDLQYFYDAAGNRTKTITNGVTTMYTSNSRNEYTAIGSTSYTYDDNGDRISQTDASGTTSYTYNADGLLSKVTPATGSSTTYQYNAFGGLYSTIQNGLQTNNLFDPLSGTLVGQFGSDGTIQARYNYGIGLVSQVGPTGTTSYYDFDLRGSTVGMTNAVGAYVNSYSYLPFGAVASATTALANPFQFVGQFGVISNSGQPTFMGLRQYDAAIGLFLEEDPAGQLGGDLNLHRYADNNPITRIDPDGLDAGSPINTYKFVPFDYAKRMKEEEEAEKFEAICGILAKVSIVLNQLEAKHKLTHDQVIKALDMIAFNLFVSELEIFRQARDPSPLAENPANPVSVIGISVGVVGVFGTPVIGGGPPSPDSPSEDTGTPVTDPPPVDALPDPLPNPPLPDPPVEAQEPVATSATNTHDPNDLIGPAGFGPQGFITGDLQSFPYRIDFENSPTASDAVQRVVVTNQLDPDLDWSTLEFTGAGFGDTVITVPAGSQYFQTTVPMTFNGVSFVVEVTLRINSNTGLVVATFQALNPETSLPPVASTGFLPPEDETGRGTGYLTYVIKPKPNLATGTKIPNIATIVFDTNPAITTDQIDTDDPSKGVDPAKQALLTIDAAGPTSSVTALPAQSPASFNVNWSGTDDLNGSGIASYDIYANIDGGEYALWLPATTQTSATYAGALNQTYRFYSIARDNVGHVELAPATADATTFVAPLPPVVANQSFNVPENSAANTTLGTVQVGASSGLGALVYSITAGNSAGLFAIDPSTGVISLATGASLNFEATSTYTVTVQVTDTGAPNLDTAAQMTIHVTDVNEAPVIPSGQAFNVAGSAAVNAVVGTVTASDPDTAAPNNTRTFSIVNGTGAFAIDPQTGQITVANSAALTAMAGQTVTLQISDVDGGTPPLSVTQTVTINVGPADTAPVLATPGQSPTYFGNLKTPVKVVPTITVTDADGPATLSAILISLNLGAAKKNPDVVSLPGLSAIGALETSIVGGRMQITVLLKLGVTNAAVQTALQGMTFQTAGKGLKVANRDFQIQLLDRTGLHSNLISQTVHVAKKAPKPPKPPRH